jgi:hypothetical protein
MLMSCAHVLEQHLLCLTDPAWLAGWSTSVATFCVSRHDRDRDHVWNCMYVIEDVFWIRSKENRLTRGPEVGQLLRSTLSDVGLGLGMPAGQLVAHGR